MDGLKALGMSKGDPEEVACVHQEKAMASKSPSMSLRSSTDGLSNAVD